MTGEVGEMLISMTTVSIGGSVHLGEIDGLFTGGSCNSICKCYVCFKMV